jgi:hypothetical protein
MSNSLTIAENQKLNVLENTIARGLRYYIEVGQALLTIRNEELYKTYGTFEDYCEKRWSMSRRHAYRLIEANEVVEDLRPIGHIPTNEAQAREIAALPREERAPVWQQVIDTAPDTGITASFVRETVETYTSSMKPKVNRAADEYVAQGFDACQTPPEAVDPLLPYLNVDWTVWECAAGERFLVNALHDSGFHSLTASDIITGENFFDYEPAQWDCIVTNPPYTLKYRWLERCYALGKPFALLLPVETLGAKTAQEFFRNCGLEVIFLDKRVNFKMPNKGWEGSSAQFPVAWFTYGLNIGQQMTFARVNNETE